MNVSACLATYLVHVDVKDLSLGSWPGGLPPIFLWDLKRFMVDCYHFGQPVDMRLKNSVKVKKGQNYMTTDEFFPESKVK